MIAFEIFFFFIKGLWLDLRYLHLIRTLMSKESLHLVIKVSKLDLLRSWLDSKLKIFFVIFLQKNCYNLFIELV